MCTWVCVDVWMWIACVIGLQQTIYYRTNNASMACVPESFHRSLSSASFKRAEFPGVPTFYTPFYPLASKLRCENLQY